MESPKPTQPPQSHDPAPRTGPEATPADREAAGTEPGAAGADRGERTRRALLDTAERLFAEHGFAATSLRRITSAAGANLAAVHYHFGSKQELFRALFHRRVEPINRARLERLERIEADAAPQLPSLHDLIDALVRPVLEVRTQPGGSNFARLVARLLAEPHEHLAAVHGEFEQVRERFLPAIAAHVPHLDRERLATRMQFTIGSMAVVLSQAHRLEELSCSGGPLLPADRIVDELVLFATAGLAADPNAAPPPPASPTSKKRS